MADLILTTFDGVPEPPRGDLRDLRLRWALNEAGLPYRVEITPFRDRQPAQFSHRPFGQVPWLTDGDVSVFESGAILLHLGERSDKPMPAEPRGRGEAKEWLSAALASVEAASQPWSFFKFSGGTGETPMRGVFEDFLKPHRLRHGCGSRPLPRALDARRGPQRGGAPREEGGPNAAGSTGTGISMP